MFMLKCSWLGSLLPNGSCITMLSTNSFCEDSTISNTLAALVGCNTCSVKKLSCTWHKNLWSSTPVLCSELHNTLHTNLLYDGTINMKFCKVKYYIYMKIFKEGFTTVTSRISLKRLCICSICHFGGEFILTFS